VEVAKLDDHLPPQRTQWNCDSKVVKHFPIPDAQRAARVLHEYFERLVENQLVVRSELEVPRRAHAATLALLSLAVGRSVLNYSRCWQKFTNAVEMQASVSVWSNFRAHV